MFLIYTPLWVVLYYAYYLFASFVEYKTLITFVNKHKFTEECVSYTACLSFLYFSNINISISYYIYDTIRSILDKDYLIITHHLITLYLLVSLIDDTYNVIILAAMKMVKFSDVCLYIRSIIRYSNLPILSPVISDLIQIISLLITSILWIIYRCVKVTYYIKMFPLHYALPIVMLYIASIWWITQMIKTMYYISRKLLYYYKI